MPLPGPAGADIATLAPPGARFVTIDGERIHIRHEGPGDGRPVVLIHGLGGSIFSWRRAVPELVDAGFRVLAIDLRGLGLSERSWAADHSVGAQAQLVTRVADEVGIRRAAIVGHSMGGAVAVHLALARPELVERLVLVNAWVPHDATALWPSQVLHLPPVARWAQLSLRALATPERVTDVLRALYHDPDDVGQADAAGHLLATRVRGWDEAIVAIVRDLGRSRLPGRVSDVDVPTLIVWGAHDRWVSPARAPRLRDAIPGAQLVVIADAGHLPFEEQPDDFIAAVLPFLEASP